MSGEVKQIDTGMILSHPLSLGRGIEKLCKKPSS
jgi:hypothetical protein